MNLVRMARSSFGIQSSQSNDTTRQSRPGDLEFILRESSLRKSPCQRIMDTCTDFLEKDPEKLEGMWLVREGLEMMVNGEYVELLSVSESNDSDQKSSGIGNILLGTLLGGNGGSSNGTGRSTVHRSKNSTGQPIHLKLIDASTNPELIPEEKLSSNSGSTKYLVWSTMEMANMKPVKQGLVDLSFVSAVQPEKQMLLSLRNDRGQCLIQVQYRDIGVRDEWVRALRASLKYFSTELGEEVSQRRGLLYHQKRKLELEQRKREREEQKQKLGQVGMKYTAQAMMQRT